MYEFSCCSVNQRIVARVDGSEEENIYICHENQHSIDLAAASGYASHRK